MRNMFLLILATTALLLSGCGKKEPAPTIASDLPDRTGRHPISLQLNWFPESEHGGYYHARKAGIYDTHGLNVDIIKGGPNTPVEVQVATGRVDFGIVNADKLLATRVQGLPLVGLLAPFQSSPRCIIVRQNSPVTSLAELGQLDTLVANSAKPYMRFLQDKYDLSSLTIIPYKGGMATFLAKPNYGIQGYVTSEPLTIASKGVEVRSLMLSEVGFNPYTSVLVTSEKLIKEKPDLVRFMVQASQQGWVNYLADPSLANAEIKRDNPELEDEVLSYGAEQLKALMLTDETKANGFGSMTNQRWELLKQQLVSCKIIDETDEPVQDCFSNSFLSPEIH